MVFICQITHSINDIFCDSTRSQDLFGRSKEYIHKVRKTCFCKDNIIWGLIEKDIADFWEFFKCLVEFSNESLGFPYSFILITHYIFAQASRRQACLDT